MSRLLTKWAVLSMGIVFHLAFLMSIFDIYFVSPLVHGMRHFNPLNPDPAKRLVLAVGDGLRADKCYEPQLHPISGEMEVLAPFIMGKVQSSAMSGISHTRMPTESRPGHVALIAGFYEDVSAVTKGWQTNPVDFDSVFNQSTHTWSMGSPDILPMFAIGAEPGRVDAKSYDHTFEDFTKSSIELDRFVFDGMDALFDAATSNKTLDAMLRQDGVVFFLHLLGIDTAGHSKRPYSAEYYDNIKFIDAELARFEQRINSFYQDSETAWVFTADHGMSDLGSHGDGHPDNTRTPLVAWGKGVRSDPQPDEIMALDVQQADIATLMAYLIGANYPANSVGELPINYLDADVETRSRALAANAYSIAEQYLVKESRVAQSQMRFKPFKDLSDANSVAARTAHIEQLLSSQRWTEAASEAEDLMMVGLKGLRYLQQYNWLLLRGLVTLGFLGWIAFALTSFLYLFIADKQPPSSSPLLLAFFVAVFSGLAALLRQQKSPWNYYFYVFFPTLFWYVVLKSRETVTQGLTRLFEGRITVKHVLSILFSVAVLEGMVAGYFYRELYSVMLIAVFLPWPWVHNWRVALANWINAGLWSLACLALSIFCVLPVNKVENLELITGSGILMAVISFAYTVYVISKVRLSSTTMVTCGFQLSLIVLATLVTRVSVRSLQAGKGLPIGSQLVGWMTLLFSMLVPFMHSLSPVADYRLRLLNVFMMFSPTMIILTISYEGYFYVAFGMLMYAWMHLEAAFSDNQSSQKLTLGSFRMAIMFLFFTHIAFFGTGNIASISSFSLDSVYRLIPIFSPFSMGALLILKILVPFLVLSVSLGLINLRKRLPKYALFSMVLSVSDVLSLNFFYLVVDEGSWLDIGTGISHYCICSMLCLFIILLEYLSTALVSGVELLPTA